MDDSNVPIFAQAKLEYTKQLVDVLYMNMYDGIRSIYDDSKQLYNQKTTSIIYIFRSLLEKVPTWNTEVIDTETERIMKASKCDWLDDLLTAVFISHTRILMSIGPNQNYNKINVTIPKTTTFIHKSYINIAREVWKNPYLFSEQVPGHEYQRNMKQLEDMIKLTIEDTIRRQLPIKEILKEHLETYDEPTQTNKTPIDMQMIMNEIKKASIQQQDKEPNELSDTDIHEPYVSDTVEDISQVTEDIPKVTDGIPKVIDGIPKVIDGIPKVTDGIPKVTDGIPKVTDDIPKVIDGIPKVTDDIPKVTDDIPIKSIFSREDDIEPTTSMGKSPLAEVTSEYPYRDPEDPDDEQIRKATQSIVLNDITEPVVEERYDNSDIVVSNISTDNKAVADKLNDMMKELDKSPISDNTIKPISTDKKLPTTITSVVKIDDSKVSIDKQPNMIQSDVIQSKPIEDTQSSQPFSFSNLYPNLSGPGSGKVEEISSKDTKEDISGKVTVVDNSKDNSKDITKKNIKDINASTMTEVISLDKKEEKLDDTITLDNFFNDVKQMALPMEPMKEETKYTLFEDAIDKER